MAYGLTFDNTFLGSSSHALRHGCMTDHQSRYSTRLDRTESAATLARSIQYSR